MPLADGYHPSHDLAQLIRRNEMTDITTGVKSILSNTTLFKMLTKKELEDIAASTSPLRVKQNMGVIKPGDRADGAYWIVYGQVQLSFHTNQGNEKTLVILGENKCFGLGEMLLEKPHQTYVKTDDVANG